MFDNYMELRLLDYFVPFNCRPHSTESFTHKKMTLSLADRSTKKQKVKILPISGHDPESQRSEMIKVGYTLYLLTMFKWHL